MSRVYLVPVLPAKRVYPNWAGKHLLKMETVDLKLAPSDEAVRLGIIGTGLAVKWIHWPVLQKLAGMYTVVTVCDIDPAAAEATAQKAAEELGSPGCTWTTDYHDVLSNPAVEAVLIALPIQLTARVILEAVRAGKHVLAEKPLASNLEQARNLVETLGEYKNLVVEIAENYHYRTDLQKAKEWIAAGRIGEPILIEMSSHHWVDKDRGFGTTPWRQTDEYGGGILVDAAIHHIAGLRELGGDIARLQAFITSAHPFMAGPDTLNLSLQFRNGVIGSLLFSGAIKTAQPRYMEVAVYGTRGEIKISYGQAVLNASSGENDKPTLVEEVTLTREDSGYLSEFKNFYEAIRQGAAVISTVEETYHDFEIITQAINSAASGQIVQF